MSEPTLTGAQKSFLRSLGQTMDPVLKVGKAGLTRAFFQELNRLLESNELVKLRFLGGDRTERDASIARIIAEAPCALAGQVGQTALFFRANPSEAKRRITLP